MDKLVPRYLPTTYYFYKTRQSCVSSNHCLFRLVPQAKYGSMMDRKDEVARDCVLLFLSLTG